MLTDLYGYIYRNKSKLKPFEIRKQLKEIQQIQMLLEKELKLKEAV